MKLNKIILQICICTAILAAAQSDIHTKDNRFGDFINKIAEAIEENYTLAELLDIGEKTADAVVNIPAAVNNAVLDVNEKALYGNPLGEEGPIHNVYAAAGGRVLRTGIREGIGLYVMIEHPDRSGKISTYGHLSSIRVVSAERVTKGTIIGNYDADSGSEFYYTLEDMSGNLS